MHHPGSNIPIEVLFLRSEKDMSDSFTNYSLHLLALYQQLMSLLQDMVGMILSMFSLEFLRSIIQVTNLLHVYPM